MNGTPATAARRGVAPPAEIVPNPGYTPHLQDEHRQRQHKAHPESLRHIYQFMVRDRLGGDLHRFERRAADRATAGADLPAFRIHRAGLDAARLGRFSGFGCQIALRIGREFCPAAGTAKMVNHAIVLVPMF